MCRISFKCIAPEESRIHDADGDHVGDIYTQDDVLHPGGRIYAVHMLEDPRGFVRVKDRNRIRRVAGEPLLSHPFLS